MIGEVVRGDSMPDLISYLFGPGKRNEHVNQHLVAGYADAVFTADDRLWKDEPGIQRHIPKQARRLGWEIEFPHSAWQAEIAGGYVWHCSLSIGAGDGQLTDEQWTVAAHEVVKVLGFDGADGKAPCRWIAVRHGLSANGNDHIHIAVNLVREDGTKASTWNDYRKVGQVCSGLEDRFGLAKVGGRMTGRSLPEPSRADAEISAARGDPEPLRIGLERKVRACAAVATSEEHFTRLAQQRGLLIRPRYGPQGTITGYAFADRDARRTRDGSPVWFGGGKLAPDLTVTKLRGRWHTSASLVTRTADALAATAIAAEPAPGTLSQAARHMARAAQEPSTAATIVAEMADTFIAVSTAGNAPALQLVREMEALLDACLTAASTATARREITQAGTLVRATAQTLAAQADQQARDILQRGTTMTDITHEEELLSHLHQGAVISIRLARALLRPSGGSDLAKQTAALRDAGYTETTPYDDHLRQLFGEQRWDKYVADPARIVAAAAITDAVTAGHDVPAILTKVVRQRDWEDDQVSSARSLAGVLAYRIEREVTRRTKAAARIQHEPAIIKTTVPGVSRSSASPPRSEPAPETPFDDRLRGLLGERRWRLYAEDPRRSAVAELITQAAADGRDMDALLTRVVTSREFEDDPVSPARRVAGVLHYRIEKELATDSNPAGQDLPPHVADRLAQATAPANTRPKTTARADPARRTPPHRAHGRNTDGRDM
jgi:hypothetical protein